MTTKIYTTGYDRKTHTFFLHCSEVRETEQFYFIPREEQGFWYWSSRIHKGEANTTPEGAIERSLERIQESITKLREKLETAETYLAEFMQFKQSV